MVDTLSNHQFQGKGVAVYVIISFSCGTEIYPIIRYLNPVAAGAGFWRER